MHDDPAPDRPAPTPIYRIRLQGHLGPGLTGRFGELEVRQEADGTTTLTGPVADQAALHGLLRRIRDLCLPLLSVARVPPDDDAADGTPP